MKSLNLKKLSLSAGACLAIAGPIVAWEQTGAAVRKSISETFYDGARERNHQRVGMGIDPSEIQKACSSEADAAERSIAAGQKITVPFETRLERIRRRRAEYDKLRSQFFTDSDRTDSNRELEERAFEGLEEQEREREKQYQEHSAANLKYQREKAYNECSYKLYEATYQANPPSYLDFILGGGVSAVKWVIWYLALPASMAFVFGYGAVFFGSRIAKRYIGWLNS